jgi:hypothetical protein
MAKEVITGASITIATVDLSAFIKSVTITQTAEEKETTAFGQLAMARLGGLRDYELSIDWYMSYAASPSPYAVIQTLIGTAATCIVKKNSGTTSGTNPSFTGSFLVTEFPFIEAEHGEVHEFSTTWPYAGGTVITPATT